MYGIEMQIYILIVAENNSPRKNDRSKGTLSQY